MAERFDNLDSAEGFGFGRSRQLDKTKTTGSVRKVVDLSEIQEENISSQGYTLQNLMSGSTYTASTAVIPSVSASTELSLNHDIASSLAFFGSVYTRVSIAVDHVLGGYPNGVIIQQIISGTP
jgi:hypothetical protein